MSDPAYARVVIPLRCITDQNIGRVAEIFSYDVDDLREILKLPADDGAYPKYDTDAYVGLVEGCPCFVIEDNEWNYGAGSESDDLQDAEVPHVCYHADGCEYSDGAHVWISPTENADVDVSSSGDFIIAAQIDGTVATAHPGALAELNNFLTLVAHLFEVSES